MSEYRQWLESEFAKRKAKNPRYSQRAYAQGLGLSPSSLCRVLAGKRQLSRLAAETIIQRTRMSLNEREVFLRSAMGLSDDPAMARDVELHNRAANTFPCDFAWSLMKLDPARRESLCARMKQFQIEIERDFKSTEPEASQLCVLSIQLFPLKKKSPNE